MVCGIVSRSESLLSGSDSKPKINKFKLFLMTHKKSINVASTRKREINYLRIAVNIYEKANEIPAEVKGNLPPAKA